MNPASQPRKLYRSTSDRMIAGVAGGFAEYFNVDSTIMRLGLLLLILTGGVGVVLYGIAWIIIPERPTEREATTDQSSTIATKVEGVAQEIKERVMPEMATVGKDLADKAEKIAREVRGTETTPTNSTARSIPDSRKMSGMWLIAIGVILLFSVWFGFDGWLKLWPLLVIALGLGVLLRGRRHG